MAYQAFVSEMLLINLIATQRPHLCHTLHKATHSLTRVLFLNATHIQELVVQIAPLYRDAHSESCGHCESLLAQSHFTI